ncbi:MAG: SAM-dependent DNA methyltransferase [Planctomycetota bacterium]|nr:SAM-dependent DNA methyltransferase [Planctomycetota bacterium]
MATITPPKTVNSRTTASNITASCTTAYQPPAAKTVNSRQRVIDHGEVFTPDWLLKDMLDLVGHEFDRLEPRFLEPACGEGNFLYEVLFRKLRRVSDFHPRSSLKWQRDAILSVSTIYGIDLLADNVAICRQRLLKIVCDRYIERFKTPLPEATARTAGYILSKNIVHGDALTLRTSEDQPIIFPEWAFIGGNTVKRRDFTFAQLLERPDLKCPTLFDNQSQERFVNDHGDDVFVPTPVAEYRPCHYLKLADAEHLRINDAEGTA